MFSSGVSIVDESEVDVTKLSLTCGNCGTKLDILRHSWEGRIRTGGELDLVLVFHIGHKCKRKRED